MNKTKHFSASTVSLPASNSYTHTHCGISRASPKEGRFTWKVCRPGLEFGFFHTATLWALGTAASLTPAARNSK